MTKIRSIIAPLLAALLIVASGTAALAAYYEGGYIDCPAGDQVYTAATTFQTTYHKAPSSVVRYAAYHSAYQFHIEYTGLNYVSSWRIDATAFDGSGSAGCT